ncbi:cupin domain-containing protein [Salinisphaera sp. Q1T1-3]|uniref:cupin domain-containing protein n=1 Tax=Salinisphaera sp. Q1T1-3 TaxID=2321229 RepID=UPI000E729E4A|nr:cupin domain-containing protein [Salinisphaera sp. Q1T1-3]RJS94066.1 cupin domain-containing protein [Salinisphaera sp. Q1T1-3]
MTDNDRFAFHDVADIATRFPDQSDTILVDTYLTDSPEASARVFRIYHPLPAHYHINCDEHLYLYSGEVVFRIGDAAPRTITPGQMVTFKRETVHAIEQITAHPAVFVTLDTPRRAPDDVVFVNPADARQRAFVTNLDEIAGTD